MMIANYLVQTVDGVLHCYWDKDLLRIDLREQPIDDVVTIFRLRTSFKPIYIPVTREEVLE
jgi:hypothetical protein